MEFNNQMTLFVVILTRRVHIEVRPFYWKIFLYDYNKYNREFGVFDHALSWLCFVIYWRTQKKNYHGKS
jgi:hypothetical protein